MDRIFKKSGLPLEQDALAKWFALMISRGMKLQRDHELPGPIVTKLALEYIKVYCTDSSIRLVMVDPEHNFPIDKSQQLPLVLCIPDLYSHPSQGLHYFAVLCAKQEQTSLVVLCPPDIDNALLVDHLAKCFFKSEHDDEITFFVYHVLKSNSPFERAMVLLQLLDIGYEFSWDFPDEPNKLPSPLHIDGAMQMFSAMQRHFWETLFDFMPAAKALESHMTIPVSRVQIQDYMKGRCFFCLASGLDHHAKYTVCTKCKAVLQVLTKCEPQWDKALTANAELSQYKTIAAFQERWPRASYAGCALCQRFDHPTFTCKGTTLCLLCYDRMKVLGLEFRYEPAESPAFQSTPYHLLQSHSNDLKRSADQSEPAKRQRGDELDAPTLWRYMVMIDRIQNLLKPEQFIAGDYLARFVGIRKLSQSDLESYMDQVKPDQEENNTEDLKKVMLRQLRIISGLLRSDSTAVFFRGTPKLHKDLAAMCAANRSRCILLSEYIEHVYGKNPVKFFMMKNILSVNH